MGSASRTGPGEVWLFDIRSMAWTLLPLLNGASNSLTAYSLGFYAPNLWVVQNSPGNVVGVSLTRFSAARKASCIAPIWSN